MNGSIYTRVQHGFVDTCFRSFSIRPDDYTRVIRQSPLNVHWSLAKLILRFGSLLLPF
jgi:hypothetical protein